MKKPSFAVFARMVGALFTREDNSGFIRVWGHLVDESERTITFWQHRPDEPIQFKFLETYQTPTPLTEKEDEKEGKGYQRVDVASERGAELLEVIRLAYHCAVEDGNFHFTPAI